MTSHQATLLFRCSPANPSTTLLPLTTRINCSGFYQVSTRAKRSSDFRFRCIQGLSHYNVQVSQWPEKTYIAHEENKLTPKVLESNEIRQRVEVIRQKLQCIEDGELSISAYDTAWVALVKDIHGSDAPQFPSSLEWIINSQLPDGSWGDPCFFSPYDRLSSTLACVVALTTWKLCPEKCEKGMSFIRQNLHKLKDEDPEHMPSGFEVRFPSLVEMAQDLGLEMSQDSGVLQYLYAIRELKIPKEMLLNVPTTLLYSLEGMPDLDWEKLLKLQHPNGSFLCSTSSTAYALMQTKDEKCLNYLMGVVKRFHGVPHCYPIDLFERLWVIDRLERLGISRYFNSEIKDCLDYVYRFWTPNGISWSRDTIELDIDDTSMGFRILRSHGYEVQANAFQHFEKEGQFFCFVGQTSQGVTEMLSLYRASQVLFPSEKILEEAKKFASKFLREKQDLGQVADRWIISKDLVGEVQYNLDIPLYASLPRLETRYYIDQYGGDDDVWIGKVLY
ncbi:Copalyl diphosphate synthase, partial [Thalictrum thalictroides]